MSHYDLTERDRRTAKLLLVVEMERDVFTPPKWLRVTVSLPGREGTISRVFSTEGSRVTDRDIQGLQRWLLVTVNNVFVATEGIQYSLEMVEEE